MNESDECNPKPGGFRAARGILGPARNGESPEVTIRRLRDEWGNMDPNDITYPWRWRAERAEADMVAGLVREDDTLQELQRAEAERDDYHHRWQKNTIERNQLRREVVAALRIGAYNGRAERDQARLERDLALAERDAARQAADYAGEWLERKRQWAAAWKAAAKDWRHTAADLREGVDIALAEINTAEPYVIRISRREFMELPLHTRCQITERQTMDFCALMEVERDDLRRQLEAKP